MSSSRYVTSTSFSRVLFAHGQYSHLGGIWAKNPMKINKISKNQTESSLLVNYTSCLSNKKNWVICTLRLRAVVMFLFILSSICLLIFPIFQSLPLLRLASPPPSTPSLPFLRLASPPLSTPSFLPQRPASRPLSTCTSFSRRAQDLVWTSASHV